MNKIEIINSLNEMGFSLSRSIKVYNKYLKENKIYDLKKYLDESPIRIFRDIFIHPLSDR